MFYCNFFIKRLKNLNKTQFIQNLFPIPSSKNLKHPKILTPKIKIHLKMLKFLTLQFDSTYVHVFESKDVFTSLLAYFPCLAPSLSAKIKFGS